MDLLQKKNEAEVNESVAKGLLAVFSFVFLIAMLCWIQIFNIHYTMILILLGVAFITLFIPAVIVLLFHCYSDKMKYLIIFSTVFFVSTAYAIFTFQAVLIFIIPTLLAGLYQDKRILWFSGIVTTVLLFLSHLFTGFYLFQPNLEPFTDMESIIRYGAVQRWLQYCLCFCLVYMMVSRIKSYQPNKFTLNETSDNEHTKREFEILMMKLSEREQEVFLLMLSGLTNIQIANKLCLSNGTVKNYISSVYDKLETKERNVLIMKYSALAVEYDRSHTHL